MLSAQQYGKPCVCCPESPGIPQYSTTYKSNVAYFGTFGYELDLNKLTEEEIKEVKEQIAFMKEYREVFQFGTFYRLKSPFEGNETVWMVTNEDRTLAIVGYYRVLNGVNQRIAVSDYRA